MSRNDDPYDDEYMSALQSWQDDYFSALDDAIVEDTIHIDCLICGELLRLCMVDDVEVMWLPVHEACATVRWPMDMRERVLEWAKRVGFFDV